MLLPSSYSLDLLAVHIIIVAAMSVHMLLVRCIETARVTACQLCYSGATSAVAIELHGAIYIIYIIHAKYNTLVDIHVKKCCSYTFRVASVIYIFHVSFALEIFSGLHVYTQGRVCGESDELHFQ